MKKILLWLEDRPTEIVDLIQKAEEKFDTVYVRRNPISIKKKLEELGGQKDVRICGIVIDIMIPHIENFGAMGKPYIKTPGGYDAGLEFVRHILLEDETWKKIPICFLTNIMEHRVQELVERYQLPSALIIEKHIGRWEKSLLDWFDTILNKTR